MTYYLEDLTRLVRTKVIVCESCQCWYWTGACNHHGYPRFELKGKAWLVHRYAYDRLVAPIDDEMTLDHLSCTSHRCIRPDHMQVVTRSENSGRANVTRWHDFKFDADGNTVERQRCAECLKRDEKPAPHPGPRGKRDTEWFDEADDAVGLDA